MDESITLTISGVDVVFEPNEVAYNSLSMKWQWITKLRHQLNMCAPLFPAKVRTH